MHGEEPLLKMMHISAHSEHMKHADVSVLWTGNLYIEHLLLLIKRPPWSSTLPEKCVFLFVCFCFVLFFLLFFLHQYLHWVSRKEVLLPLECREFLIWSFRGQKAVHAAAALDGYIYSWAIWVRINCFHIFSFLSGLWQLSIMDAQYVNNILLPFKRQHEL